jgi:hypothetical protein
MSLNNCFAPSTLCSPVCWSRTGKQLKPLFIYRKLVRVTPGTGASAVVREGSARIDILACVFLVCGLLGMLKEWHVDATVYGDDLAYDRLSSGIPRYHDDEHIRQCRRREREKARRAEESRRKR